MAQQPLVGPGPSLSTNQADAETFTWKTQQSQEKTSMPRAEFKPANPASRSTQNHVLYPMVNGIGKRKPMSKNIYEK